MERRSKSSRLLFAYCFCNLVPCLWTLSAQNKQTAIINQFKYFTLFRFNIWLRIFIWWQRRSDILFPVLTVAYTNEVCRKKLTTFSIRLLCSKETEDTYPTSIKRPQYHYPLLFNRDYWIIDFSIFHFSTSHTIITDYLHKRFFESLIW